MIQYDILISFIKSLSKAYLNLFSQKLRSSYTLFVSNLKPYRSFVHVAVDAYFCSKYLNPNWQGQMYNATIFLYQAGIRSIFNTI